MKFVDRDFLGYALGCAAASAFLFSAPLAAQSLDDEYSYYLAATCANMNFARDSLANMLPGQAGPRLTALCDGPTIVAGPIVNNASGGGASVAAAAPGEELGQRRRRARRTDKDGDSASANDSSDLSIVATRNFGVFLSLDDLHEQQKVTQFEGGRKANRFGATLGADYRFGARGLVGAAARYEKVTGDFDTGGNYETRSHGFTVYGSWFLAEGAFVDLAAGINSHSDQSHRIVSFSRTVILGGGPPIPTVVVAPALANSDKDSRDFNAQLLAGYDFAAGRTTVGPRLGIATMRTKFDGYAENGETPMTLIFDAQKETSTRSTLGLQASRAFTPSASVVVMQANIDWQHEFSDNQRVITAYFAEDLRVNRVQLRFLNEAPDRDVFVARLGAVAVFPHDFSAFVSAQSLFGHAYLSRYGGSIGIRKSF